MGDAERAVDALLEDAHLAAPDQIAALVTRHAAALGADDALVYLVDLQQRVLVPFFDSGGPGVGRTVEPLGVDATLPGRAFQHVEVLTQDAADGRIRVWLPLLDGVERLGVLGMTVDAAAALEPAYEVAGDTVDYAVDAGWARVAVLDGMGHGLRSAQLATVAVAAYRNARRADRSLTDTAAFIHDALIKAFGGNAFATAVLAELDTDTGMLS
jgi:hypothetical protein